MPKNFSEKCASQGAEIYRKVADAISTHNGINDEGIANYTGIPSIDLVRMIIKDLLWSNFLISKRIFDSKRKFFVTLYEINY